MASLSDIMIRIIFLACLASVRGLELSMNLTSDSYFCARLRCWHDVIIDGSILTVLDMSIYDVTKPDAAKLKLASVSLTGGEMYVDPAKRSDMNVTGSISRYQADIGVAFHSDRDCLYGSFQCEFTFVNVSGNIDVIRKNVTTGSQDDECGCCKMLTLETRDLREKVGDLESELASVLTQLSNIQRWINSTTWAPGSGPGYAVMGSVVTCSKGMVSNNSLEFITLWGSQLGLCDTATDGGGWIVIQRRVKGDRNFYKGWDDYKNGFGTIDGDFWIGNDVIHNLTSRGYNELRVEVEQDGRRLFAHYSYFSIDDESAEYKLSVSGYSGTAGDGMGVFDNGLFCTYDRRCNCGGGLSRSGWWQVLRCYANLNAVWNDNDDGVIWNDRGTQTALTFTEMKLRYT